MAEGPCDCATQCPNSDHCVAIELLDRKPGDDTWCIVDCTEDLAPPSRPQLSLDHPISITTRNVNRTTLAQFLASFSDEELLIPAKSATEGVELEERETTLGAVIEQAGIVISPSGASG